MKMKWDSIKFISKVLALVVVLMAGYAKKSKSNSPAEKGAVDLIQDHNVNYEDAIQHIESSSKISV